MVLLDTDSVQCSRPSSWWSLCTAEQEMVLLDTVYSVVGNGHVEHCVQCKRERSCWTLIVYSVIGDGLVRH